MNMKLTLTLLITATTWLSALSQSIPIDFEATGNGALWTWTVFENTSNPPVEIIANPDPTGANTSCTVAKFTALQTGNPWAGCESQHGADLGSFTLSAANSTVTIMVWKPVISDVGIKLVTPGGGALPELKVPNTVINQWEEITFDFSGYIGQAVYATQSVDQIVIFPDFDLGGRTQDNICYFDHAYGSGFPIVPCCSAVSEMPSPDVASLADVNDTCEVAILVAPTATDSCGLSIVGVSNAVLPITTVGTTVVTWTYAGPNGNDATQTQNIVIVCGVGINDIDAPIVSVYPNPSQDVITFSMAETIKGQIMVTDLVGREVMLQSFNSNEVVLNLTQLSSTGTYFATIIDSKGVVLGVQKFIYY
jgi:hypothetical protein